MFRLLPALATLAACQNETTRQISYFKDDTRNRVYLVEMLQPLTPDQLIDIGSAKMNSDGHRTIVFFFKAGSAPDGDPISALPSFGDVMGKMTTPELSGYAFRYDKMPTGAEELLACTPAAEGPSCSET